MATILLGAIGAGIGAGFGGTVLGLTGAVIGRAVGATLGRVIDQRLLGAGAEPVEVGRVDRFRVMGASEGTPLGTVFGRMRVGGQVIWASRFEERQERQGGKGAPQPEVTEFSYSVSLAIALCEGQIAGVGRIWADGTEIEPARLALRIYCGTEDQLPDPRIEAVEGTGQAPAYRGTAYVVIEDLALAPFGNRVPQLSFEVIRHAQPRSIPDSGNLAGQVRAVAMMPGTGEYALATSRVEYGGRRGTETAVNVNSFSGKTDFETALDQLRRELPLMGSVSLVVSWFGDDLRCGQCRLRPKVEQTDRDGRKMPWRAGGIGRQVAQVVAQREGRAVYGGTPADASVVEAIAAIRAGGQEVMFYPFVLMEQLAGNGLPDPWSDAGHQPVLPWRGRITLSVAPGRPGSPDRTAAAAAEVAGFFGSAQPGDFRIGGRKVHYDGPPEWSYRRFILHYAHLCKLAGGVDAFCIGSEMRGLTQIRAVGDAFAAVAALVQLAADVRAVLGAQTRISYAADWSEYFGYHADGNVYFHLDPLWASPAVDFIGIDNYMPLSDWRGTPAEADAAARTPHDLAYLTGNVAGGEGFDWYYDSAEGQAAQRRLPIEDGAHGEPWVFRCKDLAGWWSNQHHERIGGVRQALPTAWVPGSKPIRFTEYGCAAVDKGTNEPNRFLDAKSSESGLPRYSDGRRDDLIQMQYFRAVAAYWGDPAKNPVSAVYGGPMVDMARAHAWAWDARPFPAFPGNLDAWSDGGNYARGHWLSGRATNQTLAAVIAEIGERAGVVPHVAKAHGIVRGYAPEGVGTARVALQPLMLTAGCDPVEREGELSFVNRGLMAPLALAAEALAVSGEVDAAQELVRQPEAETAGKLRLSFVEADGDFALRQAETVFPDDRSVAVAQTEVPLLLTAAEGRAVTERWLAESRVARDTLRFALPPSRVAVGAGDVVMLDGSTWRVDRVENAGALEIEAVRCEAAVYTPSDASADAVRPRIFTPPAMVWPVFLDLPLMTGDEVPHAPHLAVTAAPWTGSVAVWSSPGTDGFALNALLPAAASIGTTETALPSAPSGTWDCGAPLRVRLVAGTFASANVAAVLNGANLLAIGDGSGDRWELLQFAEAQLVAPKTWDLSLRLRGQAGTDAVTPSVWPVGSTVVLMNRAPVQVSLPVSARRLAQTWRIGAAARGFDDPGTVELVQAFSGIGLRPYAPVHLRCEGALGTVVTATWQRRTRIDGDTWEALEVPLGEEREAYMVRILVAGEVRREAQVPQRSFQYDPAMQTADGATGGFTLAVAQLSDRFGPGPFRRLEIG